MLSVKGENYKEHSTLTPLDEVPYVLIMEGSPPTVNSLLICLYALTLFCL